MRAANPLKILMTADTMGGVWTYALELIKALAPEKVEVALATMGAPLNNSQREQLEILPQVKLYESTYKLEWMEHPWEDVEAAGRWLLEINQEFNPDIIHLNNFPHGQLNWGKPVVMVVHSCVQSWFWAVKNEAAPANWDTYRQRVKAGLQAADYVVAPSQAMLEEARKLYGPFRHEKVIYNGRHTEPFRFGRKEPFIFSMGRVWDDAKNIQMLAKTAPDLGWPVYVAGDAAHPATGQVLELPNVHFLGQLAQTEIVDYLSRASLFVLPAKYEPFGLSALEAGLSGCALVLGNIPSQVEIWGKAATYINPNNAEELKTVITKLIGDEFIRNIMSFRAIQQGLQYSVKQMVYKYDKVYRELVAASKSKAKAEFIS